MTCNEDAGRTSPLLCGVKFCGGCNPHYSRGEAFRLIKSGFEGEMTFVFAEEGGTYDLLLYFAGCTSRCTDLSLFETIGGVVGVHDEDGIAGAADKLREHLRRKAES